MRNQIDDIKKIDLRTVIRLKDEKGYGRYNAGRCPFHGDRTSLSFVVWDKRFKCYSTNCGVRGDIFVWYNWIWFGDKERPTGGRFREIVERLSGTEKPIIRELAAPVQEEAPVEDVDMYELAKVYHNELCLLPLRRKYFNKRLVNDATIDRLWLGWDGVHYTIPVWGGEPGCSDVIAMRLRATDKDVKLGALRYSNITGYGDHVLFNSYAVSKKPKLLFCFYGELDAILAEQDGLAAVSPTNGAKSFERLWLKGYKGTMIFVPDRHEEVDALEDAGLFGSHGFVFHIPDHDVKDYTDYRLAGHTVVEFKKKLGQQYPYLKTLLV